MGPFFSESANEFLYSYFLTKYFLMLLVSMIESFVEKFIKTLSRKLLKVEIFLEEREIAFLSPRKICENLNFSREKGSYCLFCQFCHILRSLGD